MANNLILKNRLETLFQSNWGDFLDHKILLKSVLEDARDQNYRVVTDSVLPKSQFKVNITRFTILSNTLECWVEFTAPMDNGVAVGTHLYEIRLDGSFELKESYGSIIKLRSDDLQ